MVVTLHLLADEEELNPHMRIWRDAVNELSYDMEDCVDDFIARVDNELHETRGFKNISIMFKESKACHAVTGQLQELKARATEESERHKRHFIDPPTPNAKTCPINPRVLAFFEEAFNLVGIDGPKEYIIEHLEVSHANLGVVSIVGLGGLGKTTLVGQVYRRIQHNFSATASVLVSRKANMKGILADIAIKVRISEITPNNDEHCLITRMREHLKDKRYFIIIDDLWELESWDQIKCALVGNNLGSRIITRTRNMAVASHCSDNVYQMEALSIADSRRLCFKRAFGYEELDSSHSHLEKVSTEILAKCVGLPFIFSMGAEDVEILGSIPALLSLELRTMGGTNGRIFIRGFTSLKHFFQKINRCGTSLEFEAGAMPKLEHLKLEFRVHKTECLNGARDFGIQHLSTLAKVDIIIGCKFDSPSRLDMATEMEEGSIDKIVVQRIKDAIETLPNRPTLSVQRRDEPCQPFREHHNQKYGASNSRIGSYQTDEHGEQVTAGETEQVVNNMSRLGLLTRLMRMKKSNRGVTPAAEIRTPVMLRWRLRNACITNNGRREAPATVSAY